MCPVLPLKHWRKLKVIVTDETECVTFNKSELSKTSRTIRTDAGPKDTRQESSQAFFTHITNSTCSSLYKLGGGKHALDDRGHLEFNSAKSVKDEVYLQPDRNRFRNPPVAHTHVPLCASSTC